MKKSRVKKFPVGSAQYVVAHAKWQEQKGRQLSATFKNWRNPHKALYYAKQEIRLKKEKARAIKLFKNPMLADLKRIIGELENELKFWNQHVLEKTGTDMGLELLSTRLLEECKWEIVVAGYSWAKRPDDPKKKKVFTISWWAGTCPAHYHLQEIGCYNLLEQRYGVKEHYLGVNKCCSRYIARNLAIYTHGTQITEVMSRFTDIPDKIAKSA